MKELAGHLAGWRSCCCMDPALAKKKQEQEAFSQLASQLLWIGFWGNYRSKTNWAQGHKSLAKTSLSASLPGASWVQLRIENRFLQHSVLFRATISGRQYSSDGVVVNVLVFGGKTWIRATTRLLAVSLAPTAAYYVSTRHTSVVWSSQ